MSVHVNRKNLYVAAKVIATLSNKRKLKL